MRLTGRLNGNGYVRCDKCELEGGGGCSLYNCRTRVIDKLAAYEDAEEQGLLVRLPCKVGDTVFVVECRTVYKSQVDSITLRDDGLWFDCTYNHFGLVYFSGEIGRNIFLTREEAEAALKGEKA